MRTICPFSVHLLEIFFPFQFKNLLNSLGQLVRQYFQAVSNSLPGSFRNMSCSEICHREKFWLSDLPTDALISVNNSDKMKHHLEVS